MKGVIMKTQALVFVCVGQGFWPGDLSMVERYNNDVIKVLGFDLAKECRKGEAILVDTQISQLLSFVVGCGEGWKIIEELNVKRRIKQGKLRLYLLGHSLGEYTALVLAEVISFPTALPLIWERGGLMKKASKRSPGGMAAITGQFNEKTVQEICSRCGTVVACDNSISELAISGPKDALQATIAKLKESNQGSSGIVPLKRVGGAFHSPLMLPAAEELQKAIYSEKFRRPATDTFLYSTVTGRRARYAWQIRRNLIDQLVQPVEFRKALTNILKRESKRPSIEVKELWPRSALAPNILQCIADVEEKKADAEERRGVRVVPDLARASN